MEDGGGGGGNGVSIGNYKGVMLCNRPFAGVSGAAAQRAYLGDGGRAAPFKSFCGSSEPLGLNPIRHAPVVVQDRPKPDTVLTRHRRFLVLT